MKLKIVYFVLISFFFTFTSAHAYLDPGTGSIILQAIFGALAAIVLALKLYWHKFLKLLGIRKKINIDQDEDKKNDKD
ncbi:hypothetical protein [Candidatus Pelagibacter communis]|uniref:hypothetical protein n=1 Tax=Pelagibacter ubique TaxID=198252 RepID=UPI000B0556EF|nr:hypothetical protein [Candidatus Pelagibacter ubique]